MDGKTLRALLDKLNSECGTMMEAAAGFTVSRGHYQITIEHLLIKKIFGSIRSNYAFSKKQYVEVSSCNCLKMS